MPTGSCSSPGRSPGSLNSQGATICVAGTAQFNPTNINGFSRVFVRGSALMPALAAESGALLDNEGTVRFLPQVNVNGLATVINRLTGTITIDAPGLALPAGATVTNDGTITVKGFVNLNGSNVTNNNVLSITGAADDVGNARQQRTDDGRWVDDDERWEPLSRTRAR